MLPMLWCYLLVLVLESCAAPSELPSPTTLSTIEVVEDQVTRLFEVPSGKNAKLLCGSNGDGYNFLFWQVHNNDIVGPWNNFDTLKYDYEILSGTLIIKAVTPDEEGVYNCFSRGVRNNSYNVRSVRMIVKRDWEDAYENDPNVNFFRVVIALASILIIMVLIFVAYKLRKRHRLHEYLENDDDEDESADEIFRAPGTSRGNIVLDKAASVDTDFGSILDNAQQK